MLSAVDLGLDVFSLYVSEADFGPASKSAIKRRIRSAVTQAEAAIAIATSLPSVNTSRLFVTNLASMNALAIMRLLTTRKRS